MPIRKKGNIKVKTSPNGYGIERTGYTFYSYDKNSAALVFTFIDSDNAPVNLSKADVQLLLISDNGDEFPVDKDDIDVISAIRGTARYVIPESLLGYEGKVTGHIYLDFEDGSHTDEGKFTFNIKRSAITNLASEFGKQYVQDFEDVKERVEQAGDSATKDIEKAKDNAESQIGDYVGEVESAKDSAVEDIDKALPEVVESAKQDISSSISDVQGKASEASEDISGLVKSTEDARDNAEIQIGEYVGEVERAKDTAVEDIDKALPEVEDKLDEVAGKISELDDQLSNQEIGGTNLLLDSDRYIKTSVYRTAAYDMSEKMEEITYTLTIKGKLGKDKNVFGAYISNDLHDLGKLKSKGNNIYQGTFDGRNDAENLKKLNIYAMPDSGTESEIEWAKLEKGNTATDWSPAPEDLGTKSELEKIKQAIIDLGGSI